MDFKFAVNETFDTLAEALAQYLKELGYCKTTTDSYRRAGQHINNYLDQENITVIDLNSYAQIIRHVQKNRNFSDLSRQEKAVCRCLEAALEYHFTGSVSFRSHRQEDHFHGTIGATIAEYLCFLEGRGLSPNTIQDKKIYLKKLQKYMESNSIFDISILTEKNVLNYCISLRQYSKATLHSNLCCLRGFLRYLHDCDILGNDLSYLIPKDNYKKQAKLPTTYTADEIQKLLQTVDRGNPKGKRDYAMILLSAYLGMRASDVCSLRFEHLDWENNVIRFRQQKTKQPIELPFLAGIGNAIIDYLKYGRPESESDYLFLHASGRYEQLNKETFHSFVTHYMYAAGIDMNNKKHGPHALRHSLATRLLQAQTPLPIISEALGHSNTDSTMIYLKIDRKQLSQCALEVPKLHIDFYGGAE